MATPTQIGDPSVKMTTESGWRQAMKEEWRARQEKEGAEKPGLLFPLAANPFGEEEILAMAEVLLTGQLTLGAQVNKAEAAFAKLVGAPYAVMVNSGSSANLLAVSAMANKLRPVHCNVGDEVLVPAVAWSTSVFPLLQNGLKPVFVDVDPQTFNTTLEALEAKMSPRVKAVMAVHVLGNAMDMTQLTNFVKKHKLIFIEDTCESLGSFCLDPEDHTKQRMLGTIGDFGCYSFYFSHHITSGEGGMVVCRTLEDYNFVRCLRAHGWTRHLTNKAEVEAMHQEVDSRFLFVNVGYNLRPLEVQAAMLNVQMSKLAEFNGYRRTNLERIHKALEADPRFAKYMSVMKPAKGVDPAWFGLGALLHRPFAHQLQELMKYLEKNGVENRPVISGNFIRQPCIKAYCEGELPENYPGAEAIHTRGFFIGVHQFPLTDDVITKLVAIMLSFPFKHRHVVMVTGSDGMLGRHVYNNVLKSCGMPITDEILKEVVAVDNKTQEETQWIFTTLHDADLRDLTQMEALFKRFQPTRVLHCAAMLKAIGEMTARPVDFWLDNVSISNNLLRTAFKFQDWVGPIKVLSVLSTVMFPKDATIPVTIDQLYSGPAHPSAESYAYAKRALAQLSGWYRKQYGPDRANFVTVLPGNFFGAYGNFEPSTAPLVNALISKAETAKKEAAGTLKVLGSGEVMRQVMYAGDLARALMWALENYDREEPLIVASEDRTIARLAEEVKKATGFQGAIQFDIAAGSGPQRRTADTTLFHQLWPDFQETPLPQALAETVAWFEKNIAQKSK